jgi:hypothetical protein
MSKAEDFLKQAEACERLARVLSQDEGSMEYRRMASHWRQLADRVTSLEEGTEVTPSDPAFRHRH